MRLFKATKVEGKTKREIWVKPEDLFEIIVESGKTFLHMYFPNIGFRQIRVQESPEEINERYAKALES